MTRHRRKSDLLNLKRSGQSIGEKYLIVGCGREKIDRG